MTFPMLSTAVSVLLVGALLTDRAPSRDAARRVAIRVLTTAGILGLLGLYSFDETLLGLQHEEFWGPFPGTASPRFAGLSWHVGIDGLSVLLVPSVALLGALVLVVAPRREHTPANLRSVLLVVAGTEGALLSVPPWLALSFFGLALASGHALLPATAWTARRVHLAVAFLGMLFLSLSLLGALGEVDTNLVALLVLFAVVGRMAVFPLHAWLPLALRDGPTSLVVVVISGISLGTVLFARLLGWAPSIAGTLAPVLVVAGMAAALYAAVLGIGRDDLMRATGSVISSQSALMLVGLAAGGEPGVSGALLQALATGAAVSGLLLTLGAVRARTGTTDVTLLGGLVQRMPLATGAYFVFAIALVGFPGSLAFVSEDLLLHGLVATHPVVALCLLLVTALNGLTVLRGGMRAFFGPKRGESFVEDLSPRERGGVVLIALVIALAGIVPGPVLAVRRDPAELVGAPSSERTGRTEASSH
jgi:NADH-quinone oxidoreductase subunit M